MCSHDILAVLTILPIMVEQASNITVREGFNQLPNITESGKTALLEWPVWAVLNGHKQSPLQR